MVYLLCQRHGKICYGRQRHLPSWYQRTYPQHLGSSSVLLSQSRLQRSLIFSHSPTTKRAFQPNPAVQRSLQRKREPLLRFPKRRRVLQLVGQVHQNQFSPHPFSNYLCPAIFSGQIKEFTKEEMLAHDRDFSKQLLFRFDAKQKQQNQVAAALSRDLRSTVVVNLNINYAVHQV